MRVAHEERHLWHEPSVDGPPTEWTIEHVYDRMVEAFEVLLRSGGRHGPSAVGSSWPAMLREFSDLVDPVAYSEAEKAGQRVRTRPSMDAISRMEEAIGWPVTYLGDQPRPADAITLWALHKASGRSLKGALRGRAARAAVLAKAAQSGADTKLLEQRQAAAKEVAAWAAKRRFLSDGSPGHLTRIRVNAHLRMQRRAEDLRPVMIKPADMMPDKVLSQTSLDRHRWVAGQAIADGLQRDRVVVR